MRNVFVPCRFEGPNPSLGLDQSRDTDHDVDHAIRAKARNRGAPDMFDNGVASLEHRGQDSAFLVESTRPIWIVRHDDHSVKPLSVAR